MINYNEYLIDYYENIALPTLDEFFQDKTDIRRAKLALVTLYHVFDYLKLSKNLTYDDLKAGCEDFVILANAANATKHGVLTRGSDLNLDNSNQIKQESYPGLFEAPFGEGTFYEASEVYLVFNDDLNLPVKRVSIILKNIKKYYDEIIY